MDTQRVIDIKKELRILKDDEEKLKENLVKIEGIESYYLNLIEKNITMIPVPNTKKDDTNFKKLLEDDDI